MAQSNQPSFSGNARSAVLSNLAKAAEKQQNQAMADDFTARAAAAWKETDTTPDLSELKEMIADDLANRYPVLKQEAEALNDRGTQRAVKWGQKVATLQKSLIDRYLSRGDALLEGKQLYICEACGFIALADSVPDICPVCKAPSSRFVRE